MAKAKNPNPLYCDGVEASKILGIDRRNLVTYKNNGSLTQIIPPGKRHGLYLRSQVEALAEKMRLFTEQGIVPNATHVEYISEKENALVQLLIDAALLIGQESSTHTFDNEWRERWLSCFREIAKVQHLETAAYQLARQEVLMRLRGQKKE